MTEKTRCEYITWSRFYALSRKLVRRVHASGYRPDIIVAIGRGGYMPARIVSDFMHIMNLTSFKIEHYAGTQKKKRAVVRYPLGQGVTGSRVLLVDDVCDTGDTFAVAAKHLENIGPAEVRTAVMHYKKTSAFVPDYCACRCSCRCLLTPVSASCTLHPGGWADPASSIEYPSSGGWS